MTQSGPWRLGLLGEAPDSFWDALRRELAANGFVEGTDFVVNMGRAGGNYDLLPMVAQKLVRESPDVIVASGNSATRAVKAATSTIPIVMIVGADPVEEGLIASLARPGGNVTGIASLSQRLTPKRLELLQELLPGITEIAVLVNASSASSPAAIRDLQDAARDYRLHLRVHGVATPDDIAAAIAAIAAERSRAIMIVPSQLLFHERSRIATLARQFRLPTISGDRDLVEAGGLASYAPNFSDMYRDAAKYVLRIRKGARAVDMPVEQPTRFELVVNMQTAKTIGVEIPPTVLARADEVIE